MAARVASWMLRISLAAVFLWAGVVKVWDFKKWNWATPDFLNDVLNYHVLPETAWYPAMFVAAYLPWLEIAAGAAVLTRRWRLGGLLWITLLLCFFIPLLASAWARGLDIRCGCFNNRTGTGEWMVRILEDIAMLAAALGALWLERASSGREELAPPPTSSSAAAV